MYFLFAPTLFFCFVDKLTELFKRPRKLHCICWLIIAILNIIVNKVVIYVFIQLLTENVWRPLKFLNNDFFKNHLGWSCGGGFFLRSQIQFFYANLAELL